MSGHEHPIAILEDTSEGILHAVYDIIKGVERDGGADDKLTQLRSRLETARSLVQGLKGTDVSPDEQLEKAELLQNQLIAKRRLLSSYKHMCGAFEIPSSQPGMNGPFNGEASHIPTSQQNNSHSSML